MRTRKSNLTIALCAMLCAIGLLGTSFQAKATGNVLLPTDSSSNDNNPPNLGLTPKIKQPPPPPPPNATSSPQAQNPSTSAQQTTSLPTVETIPPTTNNTASPSIDESASAAASLLSRFSPAKQTPLPASQQPSIIKSGSTIIIKTTTPPPPPLPPQYQLPPELQKYLPASTQMSSLKVALGTHSVWGPSDITNISDKLGITQKQVTETCILSLQGMIAASQSSTTFNTGTKGNSETQYNGKINKIYAHISALCPATAMVPSGKGIIYQIDDKYTVRLGAGNCSPQLPAQPTQLTVTYAGNGRAQCDYQ